MSDDEMNDCRAVLEGTTLILENSRIRRTFDWNGGHLISREIADKVGRAHLGADGRDTGLQLPRRGCRSDWTARCA